MKKVMIATGGTGGHIYPALALAKMILAEHPSCEIRFFGSNNRMEAEIIPQHQFRFYGIEMSGMNGNILDKAKSFFSLVHATRYCKEILREFHPDICIGFGNYISVPLILAAKQLHIPTMIHEQNSFAGKANRFLAKYADAIVASYASNLEQFPKNKTKLLGNPEATMVAKQHTPRSFIETYGLDANLPFVVFMMGSLGSSSVAKVIDESIPYFAPDYQVLIVTGKANDYVFQSKRENVTIVPYIDGPKVLQIADLAITRAGATTIAEIAALGVPSILIPSPYVPNNHQVYNAMELVKNEAAIMIEEKDLTAQHLSSVVNLCMADKTKTDRMRQNALQLGKVNAALDMVDWMEELIRQ